MKLSWTQGLEEQEKLDVVHNYKESVVMRRRLRALLDNLIDENLASARRETNYDSPSWGYHQADKLGYERALIKVLDLLED